MAKTPSGSMRRNRRVRNEINVVPYIDVMLVLLIIFMVTAPLIPPSSIDLPSVGQAQQQELNPVEINLLKNGNVQLRDRQLNEQQFQNIERDRLITVLKDKQQGQPNQAVVIGADKQIAYEKVVTLLDELQRQGITRVGLLVKQTPK